MTRLNKFLALAPGDKRLLVAAALALAGAAVAVKVVPLHRLARQPPATTLPNGNDSANGETSRQADRIAWAVQTAARQVPWPANCLVQALAATRMLRRRGIPSTLYFGVDRGPGQTLEAHAWVVAGDAEDGGDNAWERFKVIASFT